MSCELLLVSSIPHFFSPISKVRSVVADIREKRTRWSPAGISERKQRKSEYIRIFRTPIKSPEETERLFLIEDQLSVTEILLFVPLFPSRSFTHVDRDHSYRALAERDSGGRQAQTSSQKRGWIDWIWSYQLAAARRVRDALLGDLTSEQKDALYSIIEYDPQKAGGSSWRAPSGNSPTIALSLFIKGGSISLTKAGSEIARLVFSGLEVSQSWSFSAFSVRRFLFPLAHFLTLSSAGLRSAPIHSSRGTCPPRFLRSP